MVVKPEKSLLKNNFFGGVKMANIRAKNNNLGGFLGLIGCPVVFFDLFKHRDFRWVTGDVIKRRGSTPSAGWNFTAFEAEISSRVSPAFLE